MPQTEAEAISPPLLALGVVPLRKSARAQLACARVPDLR